MYSRLGYPDDTVNDDQILIDVILHIPSGYFVQVINAVLAYLGGTVQVPTAGFLTSATTDDKQWLTKAFLKRSANPVPPSNISTSALQTIISGKQWRLLNEFVICPDVQGGVYEKNVHIIRKNSLIGPTPFINYSLVYVSVSIPFIGVRSIPIPPGTLSALYDHNIADPADENDKLTGGGAGDTFFTHRTAGRVGPGLEPYERAFLPLRAPPFSSEITFTVLPDDSIVMSDKPGWDLSCIFPTTYVYALNTLTNTYDLSVTRPQGASPFVCFDSHGTPWPP
jgi:hypothetical protein